MRAALVLALVVGQAWQPLVAQSVLPAAFDELDVEPPLIRHEVLEESAAAYRQQFSAQVSDDNGLASVTLFWRFEGEDSYNVVNMTSVPGTQTWNGRVPTSNLESRAIEYYLQARDAGGNRTVRGFAFSPLVRRILGPDTPAGQPVAQPATVERSRVIYYVLGALALGLIAGVVSSGGGDSESGQSECGTDGCEVLITFESPVPQ